MDGSILNTIKKLLGLDADYTAFDTDIIVHINSIFMALNQMGIGSEDTFMISGSTETWEDFLEDNYSIEAVKTYIYLRVKLLFDPPTSSSVKEAYSEQIKELEWRLYTISDTSTTTTSGETTS